MLRPALLTALLVAASVLPACGTQSISASIAKPTAGYVRLNEPVVVTFNQKIDAKSVRLAIDPSTEVTVDAKSNRILVSPLKAWLPGQVYSLSLKNVKTSDHSVSLSKWKGRFATQPLVGIAGFLVDGKPVNLTAGAPPITIGPLARVTIAFTSAMSTASAPPTINDLPVAAGSFAWAADAKSVEITGTYLPYQVYRFGVGGKPVTVKGDVASDLSPLPTTARGLEPSNSSSQIPAGFQTVPAMLVVIDNAGLARPQSGLQAADIAWEYISEYNISRFTLTFFNAPPAEIGPVRSCRMINPFLGDALHGVTMCSGASDGTLRYLWGTFGSAGIPVIINDYDTGNHFLRVGFKSAPHNVFTDGGRVAKARQEFAGMGGGNYSVDSSHPDSAAGTAADPPSIPLQGVTYSFDAGCSCYRPFDHGVPRVDAGAGGAQLAVKNVVVMHVPFGPAGWTEDVNGGAGSIRYAMNGSGPAEVWSNGKLVHATWHQGADGQDYYQNLTQPVYFTDEAGILLRLNTGLTWIHVVGNGQSS